MAVIFYKIQQLYSYYILSWLGSNQPKEIATTLVFVLAFILMEAEIFVPLSLLLAMAYSFDAIEVKSLVYTSAMVVFTMAQILVFFTMATAKGALKWQN